MLPSRLAIDFPTKSGWGWFGSCSLAAFRYRKDGSSSFA